MVLVPLNLEIRNSSADNSDTCVDEEFSDDGRLCPKNYTHIKEQIAVSNLISLLLWAAVYSCILQNIEIYVLNLHVPCIFTTDFVCKYVQSTNQYAFTEHQRSSTLHLPSLHVLSILASSPFSSSFETTEHVILFSPDTKCREKNRVYILLFWGSSTFPFRWALFALRYQ
jgi:hypothetical protein